MPRILELPPAAASQPTDTYVVQPTEYEQLLDEQSGDYVQGACISEPWVEVTQAAGDRYSFRPDGLTLFIVRGFAQNFEARLAAIESKLEVKK